MKTVLIKLYKNFSLLLNLKKEVNCCRRVSLYHSQASAFKERHDKRPGIKQYVSPSKSQGHLTSILLLRLLAEDYEMNVQHAQ